MSCVANIVVRAEVVFDGYRELWCTSNVDRKILFRRELEAAHLTIHSLEEQLRQLQVAKEALEQKVRDTVGL